MKYITATDTKGPLMPKIIGKKCLKVKINKKVKNRGVVFERTKQFKMCLSHLNCLMVLNQPAPHILGSKLD